MAEQKQGEAATAQGPVPSLEELQHWTWVMGRAQQMMMEHLAAQWGEAAAKVPADPAKFASAFPAMNWFADPATISLPQ